EAPGAERRRVGAGHADGERRAATPVVEDDARGDADDRKAGRTMPHLHVRGSAAGAGEREPHAGQDLALADRALKNASEELAPRHAALASGTAQRGLTVEREKHRGPVGRRVRVDEAAADRASVSHLEVADRLRGLGEQMNATELGAR